MPWHGGKIMGRQFGHSAVVAKRLLESIQKRQQACAHSEWMLYATSNGKIVCEGCGMELAK